MRLYRTEYKGKNGEKRQCATWTLEFRGPIKVERIALGVSDRQQAEVAKLAVASLRDCAKLHQEPPSEYVKWAREQEPRLRAKIEKAGLIPASQTNQSKPILEHLADYKSSLLARKNTTEYCEQVERQVSVIIEGCGFKFWPDVNGSEITRYVSGIKEIGGRTISDLTKAKYVLMFRQFTNWLLEDGRIDKPIKIKGIKYVKNPQRALEMDEWKKLIEATRNGPTRYNLTGAERVLIYTLTVEAGLRRDEVNALTPESLVRKMAEKRDGSRGRADYVFIPGKKIKNRKSACQRITSETAAKLRRIAKNKLPGVKLFRLTQRAAEVIQADAEAAGIEIQNENGKINFHSLRRTCATFLIDQGVNLKEVQCIMRHAKIEMTIEIYTQRLKGREGEAIDLFKMLSA